jgi:alpha-mannosidase
MSLYKTAEKIDSAISHIRGQIVRQRQPLSGFKISHPRVEGDLAPDFDDSAWETLKPGATYEAREETVLLRTKVTIPDDWKGAKVMVALQLIEVDKATFLTEITQVETLVRIDGAPAQAIDSFHHDLLLTDNAEPGRTYTLTLEAYTGRGDNWGKRNPGPHPTTVKTAELQWIDRETEALYHDMRVANDSAKTMDANSRERTVIVNVLDETVTLIDLRQGAGDSFYESVKAAREFVQANLYRKYHADPNFTPTIWANGHAHIDTAWLWRVQHTRMKIGRTFTTALALMDQYPDYHFTCSQPQQYAYLKEDYPEVFAGIKKRIADGRWEAVGGMWVESDCNLASGESLVRHFLYGLRFYKQEFGVHTNVVWLPDVFGYSAAFPQIIKKSGMKYFMTIKIYWNDVNKPPYQTFEWEGIDGTSVLAHFSPLGDYNALMTPEQLRKNWTEYKQKDVNDSALYIYGYGDGGGGPTREMLETAARLKDFPGMPRVKLTTGEAFFDDLARQTAASPRTPRWVGELYLEYHRGTYTSQARNKRLNRRSEILLQTAEQTAVIAGRLTGTEYPQDALNKAWELLLLNQFHDIIPGSSIHEVYEDSDKDYEEIKALGGKAAIQSLISLSLGVAAQKGDTLLYNPLSWSRSDVVELPRALNVVGQPVTDLDGAEKTLVALDNIPSLGYTTVGAGTATVGGGGLSASKTGLENQFFTLTLDANGEIESLWDKRAGREVIDPSSYCKGNALLTFEDRPINFDAWDIDIFYQEKMTPVRELASITVIETGPLRASVEITRTFGGGSAVTQRISVYRDSPRIDFDTVVDWRERQTLLKTAFPVTVRSPRATYDIQFGNVERPTHWNTSWDYARYEVCAHKWADLSEGDYGVSLLSDCKYGWDIKDNVMRLTLLKGAVAPDPEADLGRHRFTYSLLPHAGDWRAAGTVRHAYELNVPVWHAPVHGGGTLPAAWSFVSVDKPNLIVETVKKAEDSGDTIVRLYEAYGQRGAATLTFAEPVKAAGEVNLMEEETAETKDARVTVSGTGVSFDFTPYEIKTFKVRF